MQIVDTILGRMSFTGVAIYIAVHCTFDKLLYLTSCLNAQNHNMCTFVLNRFYCAIMALFIINQDRQTHVLPASQHMFIHLSPVKCSIASACNNPSDNISEKRYFGIVRLLQPKTKQSHIC